MLFDTPGWSIKGGLANEGKKQEQKKRRRSDAGADQPSSSREGFGGVEGGKDGRKQDGGASKKRKKDKKQKLQQLNGHVEAVPAPSAPVPSTSTARSFHSSLLSSLSGSRFRLLNETLYTTPGSSALELMSNDLSSFEAYHQGFRKQTEKWPVNPVDVLVKKIKAAARRGTTTVVADLGCGEAGLAKVLMRSSAGKKGKAKEEGADFRVFSFDLCADNEGWVVKAECSSHVPLPGSHQSEAAQMVDVVACCLSLMGTDWVGMVLEARRILRNGGRLHVAEVTSRFPSIPAFISFFASLGFSSLSVDEKTSTHFVLFEFAKTSMDGEGGKRALDGVGARSEVVKEGKDLLKPCIYKRR